MTGSVVFIIVCERGKKAIHKTPIRPFKRLLPLSFPTTTTTTRTTVQLPTVHSHYPRHHGVSGHLRRRRPSADIRPARLGGCRGTTRLVSTVLQMFGMAGQRTRRRTRRRPVSVRLSLSLLSTSCLVTCSCREHVHTHSLVTHASSRLSMYLSTSVAVTRSDESICPVPAELTTSYRLSRRRRFGMPTFRIVSPRIRWYVLSVVATCLLLVPSWFAHYRHEWCLTALFLYEYV